MRTKRVSRHAEDRAFLRGIAPSCSPSPPPPADYAGAAQAQGAANVAAARTTGRMSNPNVYTPYGTQTVTWGRKIDRPAWQAALQKYRAGLGPEPDRNNFRVQGDQATVRQTLSPEQQRIFNINQRGQLGLAQVGADAVNRVGGILGQDVNFDKSLGTQAEGKQAVIDSLMRRYDTDLGRRKDQVNSDLVAKGLAPGTEAYSREMEMLDRGRNDAYQQATLAADERSLTDRRQAITEMLAERQTPLNEISALRSGSQVAPLQFQNFQGSNVNAAPVFAGAQAQGQQAGDIYNANVASSNSNKQMAGTALMMGAMMF